MTDHELVALARAHQVATAVVVDGQEKVVGDDTLRAVLGALGVAASTREDTMTSLDLMRGSWNPLPHVATTMQGRSLRIEALLPAGRLVQARVETSDGQVHALRVEATAEEVVLARDRVREVAVTVPADLPPGRHLITVDFGDGGAACPLIIGPAVLPQPPALTGRQGWGVVGAVGAVGSDLTAGHAPDLGDLAELVSWVADELRGDFVVLPEATGIPAPFLDPARARVRDIPEAAWVEGPARALLSSSHTDALRAVYAVPRTPRRERAFDLFCEQAGQPLVDLATYLALADRLGPDSTRWPAGLRHATDLGVAQARDDRAAEVQFHRWSQWVADEQLGSIGRAATASGMGVGLIQTLVPGGPPASAGPSARAASDWMHAQSLVSGVTLGAPPGDTLPGGEVGSRRPWNPQVLRDTGYGLLTDLVRHSLRHTQGVLLPRFVDLQRQWWVPEGAGPAEGTWVGQQHEALLASVAVEALASGAVVIGGTAQMEPWAVQWAAGLGVLPHLGLVGATGLRHPDELPITALATLGVPSGSLPDALRLRLVHRALVPVGASLLDQGRAAQRYLGWMPSLLRGVDVADLDGEGGGAPTVETLGASSWARRLARQLSQR